MELLQLRYFCHAAMTENFSKTAKEFHVPQSNISQSIKRLEDELSVSFFSRKGNRVVLNERGRAFYQEVSEALEQIENAKNAACGTTGSSTLRVGIRLGRRIVNQAINAFIKQFPQVEVIATKFDSNSEPDDMDIIVADKELEVDGFVSELVFHDKIVLITPKGLFPCGPSVCAEDLRMQSFITPKEGSFMHQYTFKICKSFGFIPRITLQNESSHLVPDCVEQGIGVAFLSQQLWAPVLAGKALDIKSIGGFYRDIYIYQRKGNSPKYVNQFYKLLREEFDKEAAVK